MKKLSLFLLVLSLCACGTNKSSEPYSCVGSGPGCKPLVPQQSNVFVNAALNSNNNVNSMISRNEAQVSAFIKNRLIGLDLGGISETDYMQIAQLALWLSDASKEDIDSALTSNKDNIHRAMYVYASSLDSCFDAKSGVSVSQCFLDWKNNETSGYNTSLISLETNGKILSIDNANFTSSNADDNAVLKFGINESGKIVTLSVIKDGDQETVFNRYNSTNEFINVKTVDDKKYNSVLTYDSVGKNLGLKYSDFGTYHINSDIVADVRNDIPFAGGYPEKQIAINDIAQNISFSGQAAGTVTSYKNGADNQQVIELQNGRAYLTFDTDTKNTHITSSFDNWYTVVIDKGEKETINFENYHENDNGYDMKMISSVGVFEAPIEAETTTVSYYGKNPDSGIPTEAVGLVQFRDCGAGVACTGNYDTTPEIKLDMAFGVHKNR